jgi:hypothetical protein
MLLVRPFRTHIVKGILTISLSRLQPYVVFDFDSDILPETYDSARMGIIGRAEYDRPGKIITKTG